MTLPGICFPPSTASAVNYAKGATYRPTAALGTLTLGQTASFTGITETNSYNERLQPKDITAISPTQALLNLTYDFHRAAGDNGNVFQVTNHRDDTRTAVYAYDGLNRLVSAQTDSTKWGDTFDYDPWGNLQHKNPIAGKTQAENFQQAADINNRITGGATLTPARIQQIQTNVPNGANVPVTQIKPQ